MPDSYLVNQTSVADVTLVYCGAHDVERDPNINYQVGASPVGI